MILLFKKISLTHFKFEEPQGLTDVESVASNKQHLRQNWVALCYKKLVTIWNWVKGKLNLEDHGAPTSVKLTKERKESKNPVEELYEKLRLFYRIIVLVFYCAIINNLKLS